MHVLIVADNALAAEGIRRELRHASGFRVMGFVNGRRPCAAVVADGRPDVVLMDDMRQADVTLARISELRMALPNVKLLLLTLDMDATWLAEACAVGADGAIAKTAQPGSLATLVREVVRGNVFHAVAQTRRPVARSEHDLTARELQILRLAAAGLSNSEIAKDLWVTEQTVKFHLSNVYRKLGVANRTQASHYAHQHRLLEPSMQRRGEEPFHAAA